jgi:hypothetical protein
MTGRPKPELRVEWRERTEVAPGLYEREPALHYFGPSSTGGLLAYVFETLDVHGRPLAKALEEAGYDLKTLRFSIRKRK